MTRIVLILAAYFQIGFVYSQEFDTVAENRRIIEETFDNLDSIFVKFHGKVIYLTLWASWCGPCKAEMPYANALFETLKDKPVVFLYLAVDDRENSWRENIIQLKIAGTHILLSKEMSRLVRSLFAIQAIPHYAIIGMNGKTSYVSTLPPSFPDTVNDILKEVAQ